MESLPPALHHALCAIVGPDGVLVGPAARRVYARDASLESAPPLAVVLPTTTEQVSALVRLAAAHGLPVVPRGAGTGLSGGAVAVQGGLLVVLTRMNRILAVDVANRTALVEPGVVNAELSQAVARYGLFYAPDPSSQPVCTIGGNVAENAGGPHCLAYGVTANHVLGLELVLADGHVVWTGGLAPDRPGYDLTGVVVGSEGTLAIVTKVLVRLLPRPEEVRTILAVFETVEAASQTVSETIAQGILPVALEMMDGLSTQAVERAMRVGLPPDAGAVLLIELEGRREEVEAQAGAVADLCQRQGARLVRTAASAAERARLWAGRKGARGALGKLAPNYYVHDVVVPRSRVPEALRRIGQIAERYSLPIATYLHAGDGNLHPNILFDARDPDQFERAMAAGAAIVAMAIELGGSITGEHGVGTEKRAFLPWLFSAEDLAFMERLRRAFDPDGRLNPEKILPTPGGCGEVRRASRLTARERSTPAPASGRPSS